MNSIVGVRFRKPGKVYFFDPDNLDIEKGQKVIVETNQGQEIGEVTTAKKEIHEESLKAPLKKVIRIATPKDIKIDESNFLITPLKPGITTLTINYKNNGESKSVSTTINVKDKIAISGLDFTEIRLFSNETYQFPSLDFLNLFPDEKITYSIDDQNIATIDDNLLIHGKEPGTCNLLISLTTSDGQSKVLSTVKLTIELNQRQKYLMIIIISAVLLVLVILAIIFIVHHVNKKGSKKASNKAYNKRRK